LHINECDVVFRSREEKRRRAQHNIADVFFSKPHTWSDRGDNFVMHTRRKLIEEEEESDEEVVFIHNSSV